MLRYVQTLVEIGSATSGTARFILQLCNAKFLCITLESQPRTETEYDWQIPTPTQLQFVKKTDKERRNAGCNCRCGIIWASNCCGFS